MIGENLMIKIIELHYPNDEPDNYQCRIIEYESFEKYVEDLKQFKVNFNSGYSIPYTVDKNKSYFNIHNNWLIIRYPRPADNRMLIHQAWIVNINS